LYDKLGHEAVDELVNHLNQIDSTYRSELKELNELNFARFQERLERVADQIRAEIASQMRDQMKWMFVFWVGTVVPLGGLILALAKDWV
jgi:hypothetical protein